MFRVPVDPTRPTFDDTFKVTFWQWLRSAKLERIMWRDRRNAAAQLAKLNQDQRVWEAVRRRAIMQADKNVMNGKWTRDQRDEYIRDLDRAAAGMRES